MSLCDHGITMTNGFYVASAKPVDLKYIADTIEDRNLYVTNNTAYEGMLVYVKETKTTYQLNIDGWSEFGFNINQFQGNVYDGLDSESPLLALSAKSGNLLNNIISDHKDNEINHITNEERQLWNSKADTSVVTESANGLMSSSDKTKLDGIETGANNYIHPNNENIRHVSDAQITYWNSKADTSVATQSTNGLMSSSDKTKLDGIETGANNYTHPDTHPATMIITDSNNRFVTDEQIIAWNSKSNSNLASQTLGGLMSSSDKSKLDSIEINANNYTHPDTHPASIIVQDVGNRFVTDTQIEFWNNKASSNVSTQSSNGLMSSTDKIKLDGIDYNANNYIHPNYTQTASGLYKITVDDTGHISNTIAVSKTDITDLGIPSTNTNTTYDLTVTQASAKENVKLNLIAGGSGHGTDSIEIVGSGATNVYRDTVSGAIVIESSDRDTLYYSANGTLLGLVKTGGSVTINNGIITVNDDSHSHIIDNIDGLQDALNTKSNSDHTHINATSTSDGLMSSSDKSKLDGIAEGANKYTHPDTHAATMIVEDASHRFVTDTEKSTWNNKAGTSVATTTANGLMSTAMVTKLNGIATGANAYTHPDTHAATIIVEDASHRFVTDTEKSTWNGKASTAVATTSANGLMSSSDKSKLDGIAEGANKYTHPDTHAASIIVQDASHRFVTDTEKSTWNGKAGTSVATQSTNGLMSSSDKTKLDGIETGANKTTVDSSMSSSSTNPVQNKIVYTYINEVVTLDYDKLSFDVTEIV